MKKVLPFIFIFGLMNLSNAQFKTADDFFDYGVWRVNLGETKGAIEAFSKAIEINPNHDQSYYYRGIQKEKIKQFDSAIEDYSECIRINPNLAEYHYNRAMLLVDKNDLRKAIIDYSNFIKLWEEIYGLNTYRHAFFNRSKAYIELKQYENAVKDLTKVVQLDPNCDYCDLVSDSPYLILAKMKIGLENFDGAIQDCNSLLKLEPENQDAMKTLKIARFLKKNG